MFLGHYYNIIIDVFLLQNCRLVEIPAYVCGMYITDKLGRRPTLGFGMVISGLSCLVTGLVPEGIIQTHIFQCLAFNCLFYYQDPPVIRIVFSLLGKFFISAVMAALYSMTVELFPTATRSITMGVCSTIGRFGGVLAPLVANAVCYCRFAHAKVCCFNNKRSSPVRFPIQTGY